MGITVKGVSLLAGVLSFAIYPQTWFPQLCITVVRVAGAEIGTTGEGDARFIDNRRITGACLIWWKRQESSEKLEKIPWWIYIIYT